jgi:hypothetical protein
LLGVCLAGLILTRPSNIVLVGILPVYLLWRTRRWQTLIVPAMVVGLFVSAWTYKTYAMTGRFVFINYANSQNIYYGNNPWTPTYETWWFGSHKEPGEDPPGFTADHLQILSHPVHERDHLFIAHALTHIRTRPDLFLVRTLSRLRTFAAFDTFVSAQLAKLSKPLGMLALGLDALSYVLLVSLSLAYPALKDQDEAPLATGEAAASVKLVKEEMRSHETVNLLLLVALLYSVPYFFAFSHPTFHVPAVPLVGFLGASVGVRLLETGVVPVWKQFSQRARVGFGIALIVLAAIQVEWIFYIFSRAS